ncbi:MAK10-like protein [Tanacetum coccineum]
MGDENLIRTLGDYSKPSYEGYRNTIELPVENNVVPLRSDTIQSITTWEDLITYFVTQFFPLGMTAKLCNDILMFQQHHGESLSEAWTRFKDLLQKVPHHGIDLWLQVQIFYDHVNPVRRRTIDQSTGGRLHDRNAEASWALLDDLTLYENESWNGPRDFAKPVKAIALPQHVPSTSDLRLIELKNQVQCLIEAHLAPMQPTQVNKITTLYEICSGPHDTQYCMEDPEQAFVKYASSRTDEARGPDMNDKGIEWLYVKEPLDLVDTSEELVYESLIKEMPKCLLNYDFRIKKGDPRNLKIPCKIRHKFMANAYIDVDLPMNIMSLAYYNSIRKNGCEYNVTPPFLHIAAKANLGYYFKVQ